MQRQLENAITTGKTVLLEEVGETIDPSLDPLMNKAVFTVDNLRKIKFGEKDLLYDDNFRLMFTTKLANPHFLPETCIKLTVINFTVTLAGLEEQLLVDVLNSQEPEVELKRD